MESTTLKDVPLDVAVIIMARGGTVPIMIFNKQWHQKSKEIAQTPAMLQAFLLETHEAYTDAVELMRGGQTTAGRVAAIMVAAEHGHANVVDLVFRSVKNPRRLLPKFIELGKYNDDPVSNAVCNRDIHTMGALYKHGMRLKYYPVIENLVRENWEDGINWLLKHDERASGCILHEALCAQKMPIVWKALEANADLNDARDAGRQVSLPSIMQLMHDLGIDVASGYEGSLEADDVEMIKLLDGLGVIQPPTMYEMIWTQVFQYETGHAAVLELITLGAPYPLGTMRLLMAGGQVPLAECVRVFAEAGVQNVSIAYPVALKAGDILTIDTLIEYGVGPYGMKDWSGAKKDAVMKVYRYFPRAVPREVIAALGEI